MSSRVRAVRLGPSGAVVERRRDGAITMRSPHPLPPYPERLTERLAHWVARAPGRTFLAERAEGGWRRISYAETLAAVRNIGQALIDRGLSPARPLAVLSGNDVEHALLGLAALHVGVPYAPISPAYSLVSKDHAKLRFILDLLTPGLVFANDGARFAPALAAALPAGAELAVTRNAPAGRKTTLLADLAATPATDAVEAAHRAVGPNTVAKLLYTSGSTGAPKVVINTQRMLCSNQAMLCAVLAFLADEPPVIVDWLPWHHTFGGNHNLGLVLYNGGTLYIDDGRPMADGIAKTVRNLREVAPTVYFNVPKGWETLAGELRRDEALRETFFSRLKLMFYAAAGLAQHVWDDLDSLARQTCGQSIVMLTGLGATESAPFAICCSPATARSGAIGLPVPGVELKLAPVADKLEARLRGPSITPGYWRQPELTAQAFDDEGFWRMGDAVRFADPDDPQKGLMFDGRIAEDFKLSTGTWVSVGPLRAKLIAHFAPLVQDVVIAAPDRDWPAALVLADLEACRALAGLGAGAPQSEVLAHPALRDELARRLAAFADESSGSSTRIAAMLLLDAPPSIDAGEVTDKGTINQRAMLANRAALVDELYADPPGAGVIVATKTVG
jgi:feruloyl-CoA synthase